MNEIDDSPLYNTVQDSIVLPIYSIHNLLYYTIYCRCILFFFLHLYNIIVYRMSSCWPLVIHFWVVLKPTSSGTWIGGFVLWIPGRRNNFDSPKREKNICVLRTNKFMPGIYGHLSKRCALELWPNLITRTHIVSWSKHFRSNILSIEPSPRTW